MPQLNPSEVRFVYAGDRQIGATILRYLLDRGAQPQGLLVPETDRASHSAELIGMCRHLDESRIWRGKEFQADSSVATLRSLGLHYIFCVHFPHIIPEVVRRIPSVGVLNLHPAYLPFNRGWHNSAWAMLDGTPYGGTLHFMDEGVDTGDIVHQKKVLLSPQDTGDTYYKKAVAAEVETFVEAWPDLLTCSPKRIPQGQTAGSAHRIRHLDDSGVRRIDLDERVRAGELLLKLRALTTSSAEEAAYFEEDGCQYRVRVAIEKRKG